MWKCSNCGLNCRDDLGRCSHCGAARDGSDSAEVGYGYWEDRLAKSQLSKRYPAVNAAIVALEILAWIVFAASIIQFSVALPAMPEGTLGYVMLRLLGGLAAWGIMLAIAALLRVVLDIENNTRRTAELLENAEWNQDSDQQQSAGRSD